MRKSSEIYLSLETLILKVEVSPPPGESLRSSLWQLYYLRKVVLSFSNLRLDRGDAESDPHSRNSKLTSEEAFDLLRLLSEIGEKIGTSF